MFHCRCIDWNGRRTASGPHRPAVRRPRAHKRASASAGRVGVVWYTLLTQPGMSQQRRTSDERRTHMACHLDVDRPLSLRSGRYFRRSRKVLIALVWKSSSQETYCTRNSRPASTYAVSSTTRSWSGTGNGGRGEQHAHTGCHNASKTRPG